MGFDGYKLVLYRNQPDGWVAEEYRAKGTTLPTDANEIVRV